MKKNELNFNDVKLEPKINGKKNKSHCTIGSGINDTNLKLILKTFFKSRKMAALALHFERKKLLWNYRICPNK